MAVSDHRAVELSCVVSGHTRHNDNSITVRVRTMQEAPHSLATWLDERKNKEVTVLVADDSTAQALSYKGETDGKGRTWSQKIRTQLYSAWTELREQGLPNVPEKFETYYNMEMEDIYNNL